MTCVGRKPGKGAASTISACREMLGPDMAHAREIEIAALPMVMWKGRDLHVLRCHGYSGKGPHTVNVPTALCWSLIDLATWCCPYHANERPGEWLEVIGQ